jgi:plastocyanin
MALIKSAFKTYVCKNMYVMIVIGTAVIMNVWSFSTVVVVGALGAHESVMKVSSPPTNKNEYYIFTQELNANESKIGVPVAVYSLTNILVHKGDNITIHFYNTADKAEDRHTFTMQSPYAIDYDLNGGKNTTFSMKASTVGEFVYYCKYDLPSMTGHLIVLP